VTVAHLVDPAKVGVPEVDALQSTRRENLRTLAEEMGGQKWLAERIERKPSQVSQLIGRRSNDYVLTKPIGNKLARHIEDMLAKDRGWLDRKHDSSRSFQIPIVEVSGFDVDDYDPANWPQSNIYITGRTRALIDGHEGDILLLACDNGMSPEIDSGDILMCKLHTEFAGDGIYVINQLGHKYVRYINLYTDNDGNLGYIIRGTASYIDEVKTTNVMFVAKVKEAWSRKKY